MKAYKILVVLAIVMLLILVLSIPREIVVNPIWYIEATPTPARMMPGEPPSHWQPPPDVIT